VTGSAPCRACLGGQALPYSIQPRCPLPPQSDNTARLHSGHQGRPQGSCCKAIVPITAQVLVYGACISGAQASLYHLMPLQRSQRWPRAGPRWLRCFNIQGRTSGAQLPLTSHSAVPSRGNDRAANNSSLAYSTLLCPRFVSPPGAGISAPGSAGISAPGSGSGRTAARPARPRLAHPEAPLRPRLRDQDVSDSGES